MSHIFAFSPPAGPHMKPRYLVVALVMALAGCKDKPADPRDLPPAPELPSTPPTVEAVAVPKGALTQLPWLMGTFRGVGTGTEEFFERNSLLNDSTLIVESFENATLTGKIDTTRYELRHDSLTSSGAGRYIATAISPDSVTFGPLSGVNNFFTWRKGDDSTWTAMIYPFGSNAGLHVYTMTRIK
jgi:hypothetical protein